MRQKKLRCADDFGLSKAHAHLNRTRRNTDLFEESIEFY
jgi:hypothetical protein